MARPLSQRARKLHLDFHTPAGIGKICTRFDADEFGDTLVAANIDAAVLFTRCHHGYSYFNTQVGVRHPGLDFDLFGAQVEACRQRDISVTAYHSVGLDSYIFDHHPDFQLRLADGSGYRQPGSNFGWMCVNTPYVDEIVYRQVREITGQYDVDAIWFDIIRFLPDSCYCRYCVARMESLGFNPKSVDDHETFNELSIARFLRTSSALVKSLKPTALASYNSHPGIGRIGSLSPHVDLREIEFGPSRHGFFTLPLHVRYQRSLGQPMVGVNTTFQNGWGDFGTLKTVTQLQYEVATCLSLGAVVNVGDQLRPNGALVKPVYEAIGHTYAFVRDREEWCIGATRVPVVALLAQKQTQQEVHGRKPPVGSLGGAMKALTEAHVQFDVIDEDADLAPYRAIVVEVEVLSAEAIERLRRYVAGGGKLLACYQTSLPRRGGLVTDFGLADVFGVTYRGESPYSINYLVVDDPLIARGIPALEHVVNERFLQVEPSGDATVLATVRYPILEVAGGKSFSHQQAPPSDEIPFWSAGIVRHRYGQGEAIYCVAPLFREYHQRNRPAARIILANALAALLGDDAVVFTDAPPSVELSLMKQPGRWVLHLTNCHTERRGGWAEMIEEIPVRRGVAVEVVAPSTVGRVYLAPDGDVLPVTRNGNRLRVAVPELHIHTMIVFDGIDD